jgi:hypothetical protein
VLGNVPAFLYLPGSLEGLFAVTHLQHASDLLAMFLGSRSGDPTDKSGDTPWRAL